MFGFNVGKPTTEKANISVGVGDTSGLEFSSTVIAYPRPQFVLTKNDGMTDTLTWNSVNNFTIHFKKNVANPCDYGLYQLSISNVFGNTVIYVNVFPQSMKKLVIDVHFLSLDKDTKYKFLLISENFVRNVCHNMLCTDAHLGPIKENWEFVITNLKICYNEFNLL